MSEEQTTDAVATTPEITSETSGNVIILEGDENTPDLVADANGNLILTEEDKKELELIQYDKARLSTEIIPGYTVPIFTSEERNVFSNNLKMDLKNIEMQYDNMKAFVETIEFARKEEGENADVSGSINAFNASYNILIEYQRSIDEFKTFIAKHQEELFNILDIDVMKVVNHYIEKTSKEFGIEYKENTLRAYLEAVGLKRAIRGEENDLIEDLFFPENNNLNFEEVVLNTLKNPKFFITVISNSNNDIDHATYEEKHVGKMITEALRRFDNIEFTTCETLDGEINGNDLLKNHIINLASLMSKKSHYDFIKHKMIYNKKLKQYREQQAKMIGSKNAKGLTIPVDNKAILSRFDAAFTELSMKKLFAYIMFKDVSVMSDRDKFKIEMSKEHTTRSVYRAIVTSFSYKFLFDELANSFSNTTILGRYLNTNDINTLKNYLAFVALDKYSSGIKMVEKEVNDATSSEAPQKTMVDEDIYNIKDLYNEYLSVLRTRLLK